MKRKDTLEELVGRAVRACKTLELDSVTIQMQMSDRFSKTFSTILQINDEKPLSDKRSDLRLLSDAIEIVRERDVAAVVAKDKLEELTDIPRFANAFMVISKNGNVRLDLTYGTDHVTLFKSQEIDLGDSPEA